MFGFLNSAFLFAAAAALIPLIIHLFSRRRVKVVEFSSLKHLKSMQKRQVRRLKIRQWLLLLIRTLIILMVVLAFARPTLETGPVGAHAAVSAVIVFDNSASMNRFVADGGLYDLAKARATQLLETFGQADEVCVIPMVKPAMSRGAEGATTKLVSAAAAQEQLDRLKPGFGRADMETSLGIARELLAASSNLNKELYIISDRQRSSLPADDLEAFADINVYTVDLPLESADNAGIVSLDFGGQLIQPGLEFTLTATVRNYGSTDLSDQIASLFINGSRVSQTDFEIVAGRENTVRFTRAVSRTGFHSGYVEISDDRFQADNRYYFSFRVPEQFNLLVINADPVAAFYKLALVPNQSLSRFWSVKEASADNLTGIDFGEYDVVLLAGVPSLDGRFVSRLKTFVRRGKSLFVVYDPDTDIEQFNRNWSDITGVIYDEPVKKTFTRSGFYTLDEMDLNHPVFSVFSFDRNDPPEIKFYTLPKVRVRDGVKVLMQFSGDRPAFTESRFGKGRVLTFTGATDPDHSDLVGHAFFVPFVSRAAEYLASDLSSLDLRLFCYQTITRSLATVNSVSYPLELVAPDSAEYSVPPEENQGVLVVRPTPIDMPGIYSLNLLGRELDRFAVNVDPAECNLQATDPDQYQSALNVENVRQLEPGVELAGAISSFRFGRELWPIFLWLAVLLVLAEMLLSRASRTEK